AGPRDGPPAPRSATRRAGAAPTAWGPAGRRLTPAEAIPGGIATSRPSRSAPRVGRPARGRPDIGRLGRPRAAARPQAGPTGPPSAAARRGRSRPARRRSPRSRDYYPGMAAFLANVGVNAAHRVRSPLHPDGSFELLPIPEKEPWAPPMLRLPGIWAGRAVHLDPDLAGRPPTYGDNC